MSLATGTRLGAYEITGRLGAGAMGEVFRARDSRLGREVALKILPPALAESSERRRRFEQESRAAGALNHPNIVAVYDTGEQDGVAYIVSELVDGESLRELIRRGPVPLRKTAEIGAQIADGLAAAHAAGIVHRDLKPENVMLTRDGRAKILDFGLARHQPAVQPTDGTVTITNPGLIMGTPGYMSPEQVAGTVVDARSDIFSLGIILYEMLAGKLAFERATTIETMNAILREDPPELPPAVPPSMRIIVLHCLEKEPPRRYQSAQDLAFALRALSGSSITAAPALAPKKARPRVPAIAAAVLGAVALFGIAGVIWAPRGTNLATYRFTPFASGAGVESYPEWSPDGKSIAYVESTPGAQDALMVRSMDSMVPVAAVRADGVRSPFWSADGTRVLFTARDGLYSVSRAGGARQQLFKGHYEAAALSPDGKNLVLWLGRDEQDHPTAKLWISSPPGAPPRKYQPVVWEETGSTSPIFLQFSPDGRQIAASVTRGSGAEIWLLPFPDGSGAHGKPHRAFNSALPGIAPGISWMPDSRHLVLSFAASYAITQLWMGDTVSGTLTPLTSGESRLEDAAVAPDGKRIAYENVIEDSDLLQLPVEGGMLGTLLASSRDESAAAWSPKSPQFAYVTSRNGRPEIWARSAQEGWERPVVMQRDFSDDNLGFFSLAFSPDGQRLAYMRNSSKRLAQIWISPAGGGQPVRATNEDDYELGPTWSPDGEWIAYTSGYHGLRKILVGAGQPSAKILDDGCQNPAQWSPDGEWIACPKPSGVVLVSPDGKMSRNIGRGAMAAWSHDSRTLYTLGEEASGKWLFTAINVKSGNERQILALGPEYNFWASMSNSSVISLSPDGKSIAATNRMVKSDIWLLQGFAQPRGWLSRLAWWRP